MACCCASCGCNFALPVSAAIDFTVVNLGRFVLNRTCNMDWSITGSGLVPSTLSSENSCKWSGHLGNTTGNPAPYSEFGEAFTYNPSVYVEVTLARVSLQLELSVFVLANENSNVGTNECGRRGSPFGEFLQQGWSKTTVVKTYDSTPPAVSSLCFDASYFPSFSGTPTGGNGDATIDLFNPLP